MSSPPKDTPITADQMAKRALILVVERNPAVQRLERFFLEQAGYRVEFARDGAAALAQAQELCPKIVVTEILVPGMDGLSLCRAFIVKPIEEEGLIDIVSKLLELNQEGAGA